MLFVANQNQAADVSEIARPVYHPSERAITDNLIPRSSSYLLLFDNIINSNCNTNNEQRTIYLHPSQPVMGGVNLVVFDLPNEYYNDELSIGRYRMPV